MGTRDPKVDAYIARSAEFARPILTRLRKVIHRACPEVEEAIKWGFPHFMYKGMLCSMASFKTHSTFGFWKGGLMFGKDSDERTKEAMGQFGRITKLADLPPEKVLAGFVRKAMKLNDEGVKVSRPPRAPGKALRIPPDLTSALRKNPKAAATFKSFTYSNKKEYVDWIVEAKSPETRERRLDTAIQWIAEGKIRNWKYVRAKV